MTEIYNAEPRPGSLDRRHRTARHRRPAPGRERADPAGRDPLGLTRGGEPVIVALSNVQFGKRNEDVRTVQKALITRGRKIPDGPTGFFGEQTRAAYRAEQLAQGFKGTDADGNPGCTSPTALGHDVHFQVDCRTAAPSPPRAGTPGRKQVPSPVPGDKVTFGFYAHGPYAWKPEPDGKAYGQWIGLHADNGHISTYCHLSERQVKAGQKVSAGRQLGKVGAIGNATGPHLHFEMSKGCTCSYGGVARPSW
ncbi:peptidoglycan DD-metalloendopeptidase family protein [Streptomyces sp. C1-1]|uniref:peptidoglycan DD-metalloendopeptidase family protein n=1 Tax=Streptomyces sp. C1-1 TaxID=3231173 RepID=UPI003D069BEA